MKGVVEPKKNEKLGLRMEVYEEGFFWGERFG